MDELQNFIVRSSMQSRLTLKAMSVVDLPLIYAQEVCARPNEYVMRN